MDQVVFAPILWAKEWQTQEGVGEGHAGDRRGVMHLLPGDEIVLRAIFDGARQISEDQLDGF
jgi:hypothetical protein